MVLDNEVNSGMIRINIVKLFCDKELVGFAEFCLSCDIKFIDEIEDVLFDAYASQCKITPEQIEQIKNKIGSIISQEEKDTRPINAEDNHGINQPKIINSHDDIDVADLETKEHIDSKDSEVVVDNSKKLFDSKYALLRAIPFPTTKKPVGPQSAQQKFQEIPVESLTLSKSTVKLLKTNNINTLAELLEFTVDGYGNLVGSGDKSKSELREVRRKYREEYAEYATLVFPKDLRNKMIIISYVRQQLGFVAGNKTLDDLDWSQKYKFARQLSETIDTLGIQMCQYAIQNIDVVSSIINMLLVTFGDVSKEQLMLNEIKNLIEKLNVNIRKAKINPLFELYSEMFADGKDLQELESLIQNFETVDDIKSIKYIDTFDNTTFIRFLKWLNFDIDLMAISLINECVANKNGLLAVLDLRSQGLTLEAIAQQKNVTRERIRQMEMVGVEKCQKVYKKYNIMKYLSAVRNGDTIITEEEFLSTINAEGKEILLYMLKSIASSHYIYEKETKIFSLSSNHVASRLAVIREIKKLPNFIMKENWIKTLLDIHKQVDVAYEYIENLALLKYRESPRYYAKCKLALSHMYEYILEHFYPTGIKLYCSETNRFKELTRKVFGDVKLPNNNRAVDARLADVAVLCNRGTYIHHSHVKIDMSVLADIDQYIEKMQRTAISYAELFELFQKDLLLKTSVNNRFYLQGVMKHVLGNKYFTTKDLISKESDVTLVDEFDTFVREKKRVTRQDILLHFNGLRETAVCQMLMRCPNIISISNAEYIHSDSLNVLPEDYGIKQLIIDNIGNVPISSRQLLQKLQSSHNSFLERNNISLHTTLFGIMQYMFKNDFSFSRPYIGKSGERGMSKINVLISLLDGYESIEIEELCSICDRNKISIMSINTFVDKISDSYLRIDKSKLLSCDNIQITDENISAIKEAFAKSLYERGYCRLNSIVDYIDYPEINLAWNPFLLRSLLQKYGDYIWIDIPSRDFYSMTTIAVDPDLMIETYEELIKYIVLSENEDRHFKNLKDLKEWLIEEQLIIRDMPNAILNSNWITIEDDGTIRLE
ncbi:MAG: hypothetical protein LBE09_06100 [Christensenellaceae bacterium]|jgi:transcriptional regulator|nr:hypothetical protein [Christensenellaceae bacterium]